VCACVCVCIFVCVCIYIHVYIYIYICLNIYIHINTYIQKHTYSYTCTYKYIYIYTHGIHTFTFSRQPNSANWHPAVGSTTASSRERTSRCAGRLWGRGRCGGTRCWSCGGSKVWGAINVSKETYICIWKDVQRRLTKETCTKCRSYCCCKVTGTKKVSK